MLSALRPRVCPKAIGAALAIAMLCSAVPALAAPKPVVAVLPFLSPHRYSAMGRNSQSSFITALVKSRKVRVVQATMVQRMLRRRSLAWTGTIEPALLKAAGQYLKADYLMAGKLRWTGSGYTLSVHVMNVRTLETTFAEDVDFRSARKMRLATRVSAAKIAAQVTGTTAKTPAAGKFLNVGARAFYDSAEAVTRQIETLMQRYRYSGQVKSTDENKRTVMLSGYGSRLKPGVPIEIVDPAAIDPGSPLVAYVVSASRNRVKVKYFTSPDDGVPLNGRASNAKHKYRIWIDKIVDEAEANQGLVDNYRATLLKKLNENGRIDALGSKAAFDRSRRTGMSPAAIRKRLFRKGIALMLVGKFYGSAGRRRADFKVLSTMTGKLLGRIRFETSL